jgi:hypothetical protein
MKTLKTGLLLFALIALLSSCDKSAKDKELYQDPLMVESLNAVFTPINEGNCGGLTSTPLIAGKNETVGEVLVGMDGTNLKVTYKIENPSVWMIKETHLAVESNLMDIPHTNTGNPKIGNFEYKENHLPFVSEFSYYIPAADLHGVYIAAHAVVVKNGTNECLSVAEREFFIPESPVDIAFKYTRIKSYYDLTFSNAGIFNGVQLGWCADNNGKPVGFQQATLISSYSSTYNLGLVVPHPENLDLLNYLMNTYYPSKSFPVIQAAIWHLMNGSYSNPSGGINLTSGQMTEYLNIIDDVKANGEGFEPGPTDYMVILVHSGDRFKYQNVFFLFKKCYMDETAWGNGVRFTNSSWAMYFMYCVK